MPRQNLLCLLSSTLIFFTTGCFSTNEYVERIRYCETHLDRTLPEKRIIAEIGNSLLDNDTHETIRECFRHKYFRRVDVGTSDVVQLFVNASNLSIAMKELVDKDPKTLVIEITHEHDELEDFGDEIQLHIDLSQLNSLPNVTELWIRAVRKYNVFYSLQYTPNQNALPLRRLHLNLYLNTFSGCSFFSALKNLELFDVNDSYLNSETFSLNSNQASDCVALLPATHNEYTLFQAYSYLLRDSPLRVLSLRNIQSGQPLDSTPSGLKLWAEALKPWSELVYLDIGKNFLTPYYNFLLNYADVYIFDFSGNFLTEGSWFDIFFLMSRPKLLSISAENLIFHPVSTDDKKYVSEIFESDIYNININDCDILDWVLNNAKACKCYIGRWPENSTIQEFCRQISVHFGNETFVRFPNVSTQEVIGSSINSIPILARTLKKSVLKFQGIDLKYAVLKDTVLYIVDQDMVYSFSDKNFEVEQSKLQVLDLSYNNMDFTNFEFFNKFILLTKLVLSANKLFPNAIQEIAAAFNSKLESLHLDETGLQDSDLEGLSQFHELKYLYLASNKLTKIPHIQAPKLQLLDLRSNNISVFPRHIFNEMQTNSLPQYLNVQDNMFQCTCNKEMLKSLERLQKLRSRIVGFENMTCLHHSGQSHFLKDLNVDEIMKVCYPSQFVTIFSVVIAILTTLIVTGFLLQIYTRKYKIKTYIYRIFSRVKSPISSKYDCYVLSAPEQNMLVQACIPEMLEKKFRFECVLPERDFPADGHEVDEVMRYMTNSRCIIALLSTEFLRNTTCLYDLNCAFGMRRRFDKHVILVAMTSLRRPVNNFNPVLREMISSGDYITWPGICNRPDDAFENFWYKIATRIYSCMRRQVQVTSNGAECPPTVERSQQEVIVLLRDSSANNLLPED